MIRDGEFYRLSSPFENNETTWMVVNEEKFEALVGYFKVLTKLNEAYNRVKLTGLDPDKLYEIIGCNSRKRDKIMLHSYIPVSHQSHSNNGCIFTN